MKITKIEPVQPRPWHTKKRELPKRAQKDVVEISLAAVAKWIHEETESMMGSHNEFLTQIDAHRRKDRVWNVVVAVQVIITVIGVVALATLMV